MHSIIEFEDDTDALGPELITLEALKLELDITVDTDDEQLDAQITRYSNLTTEHLGRRLGFANAIETFTFDQYEESRRGAALTLSLYPVFAVVSVVMNGSEVAYTVDSARGLLRLVDGRWSGTVVVTYAGGYDLPDGAPAWLSSAVIESIRLDRLASDRGDTSIRSTTHGDTSVAFFQESSASSGGGLASSVIDLLRPFRRPTAF